MKHTILFSAAFAAILSLASCSASTDGESTLTLVSYNVGAFHKADYCTDTMCEDILKEMEPDAISLNELDSCNTRSGENVFQLAQVAYALGNWPYNFASAIAYKGGTYGVGTLVNPRFTVLDKWTARLPKSDGREVRALSVIETDKFVFCSTHLDLTEASQIAQVEAIDSLIKERYNGISKPVFLCGDMNAEPNSATINLLREDWNIISSQSYTFSTSNPCKCIDFILAYKNAGKVAVKKAAVKKTFENSKLDATVASDHFPTMVVVEIQ